MEQEAYRPSSRSLEPANRKQVVAFAEKLLGTYPRAETHDPQKFIAALIAVMEDYPADKEW
jgi:hypothetical protein